jgi:branched-chain amino acid transport system ATP-binding protein
MSGALLNVQNLVAGYGSGDILQGVTLEIYPGEIVATIGRNGVGKSTLMKAVIGLLSARKGSICFKDESITHLRADQRAALGIGYVPQGREIFAELTVEENLMMGETISGAKRGFRYDLVYGYFPILRERRRQVAGTFSGGQQQMLAIGRALVGAPNLLLLDEPSVGIQPSIIQEIGQALVRLNQEEELTILLVEQNMRLIEHVAIRAYAMDKGRIVANLRSEALKDREALVKYLAV